MLEPVEPFAVVTVKFESVVVSAKVKAMSRAFVVAIVLPLVYADCKLWEAALQVMMWFDASIHNAVPVLEARPLTVR